MGGVFNDGDGSTSSFRIVWSIAVLTIVLTWAYASASNGLQPWPLDGLTTTGLFCGSGLKTAMEKMSPKK